MKKHQKFSLKARIQSFSFALQGIYTFFKTEHNAWIHLIAMIVVIVSSLMLQLNSNEWCWIIVAIGLVIITEMINTALENLTDLTSPEFHPLAKKTKDAAAGAVLIASIIAVIIGLLVFLPKMN